MTAPSADLRPCSAFAVVGPDGELRMSSLRPTEDEAWTDFLHGVSSSKDTYKMWGYTVRPVTISPPAQSQLPILPEGTLTMLPNGQDRWMFTAGQMQEYAHECIRSATPSERPGAADETRELLVACQQELHYGNTKMDVLLALVKRIDTHLAAEGQT